MKKALSVLLSMLLIFSMVGVMAFAADEDTAAEPPITVIFKPENGGEDIVIKVVSGTILTPYAPENPVKPDVEGETEYTFKGWRGEDGNLYYQSTLPTPTLGEGETEKTITFTAEYSAKDVSGFQSLWNLIESIFARINMIFEYFARIFQW